MRQDEKDMNDRLIGSDLLRRYLLGDLNDGVVLNKIELRLISDDEFADKVTTVENDLIEEFLDGELNATDSEQFIRHFLASPERKQQLRLTKNLRRFSTRTAYDIPPVERSSFDWTPKLSRRWLRFAALTVVVFVAGIGVWRLAIYQSDADRGLAELRKAYRGQRPLEPRITALPDYVPETRGTSPITVDRVSRNRAEMYLLEATKDSADAKSHHGLALVYLTDKKYEPAVQEFEIAMTGSPKDASIQSDAGAAYLEMGGRAAADKGGAKAFDLFNESLKHLDIAISVAPKMPEPRFNRALCLQALQNPEQAKQAWREYLEIDRVSKWADEARGNLQSLEATPMSERSAAELESDFLEAFRAGNEDKAVELASENRELIRGKYLPQRLAMSYVRAPDDRGDEPLRALQFAGHLEMKLSGDPFANEIARFYSTLPEKRIGLLRKAQDDVQRGYQLCLESEYDGALNAFRSASEAFKHAGNSWEVLLSRYFIGYVLINLHRPENGLRELTQVVDFAHTHGFLWLEATATHWIGGIYAQMKQHTKAKQNYERALSIAEKLKDSYSIQRNLLQLARMSSFCGQKETALNYLFRILPESNRPGNSLRQKYRNLSLALEILSAAKLYSVAKPFALEAVSVANVVGDPTWLTEAPSTAGTVLVETVEFDLARDLLNQGKASAGAIANDKTRQGMLAFSALKFGDFERRTGNYSESARYYNDAVNYYDTVSLPYNREQAHKGLMMSLFALGKNDELESQIPANIKITEDFRKQILDEQERTGYFDLRENVYDIAADFEHKRGNYERAYDYAEASSSRSLLDWLQYGTTILGKQNGREFTYGELTKPSGFEEIREKMPVGVQIVQYLVLDDKVLIWVISKKKFTVHAVSVSSRALDNKVERFSRMLSIMNENTGTDRNKLGRELYDLLIGPIRDELDPNEEVCLVPSKILFSLPFAAILTPDEKPLLSDFSIVYAPSANVFLHCSDNADKKMLSENEKFLGVGNPEFDRAKFDDLPDLRDAESEVRELTSNYEGAKTLTRKDATKTAFLKAVTEAEVIHFAGHYVVAPESPMHSFLLLAKDGQKPEDTMLTNQELAGMRLPRAKVIILAACQTGHEGNFSGEGVAGLSRTFLAADVPLVVASGWSVDTQATASLMNRFHFFRRQEHLTTTAALRRAQLEMLNDPNGRFNDPYYWAAFAVFGGHANF